MREKKNILIIIGILAVIIIVMLIVLNLLTKKEEKMEYIEQENPTLLINLDIKKIESETELFIAQECINDYFRALNNSDIDKVYDMLNKDYLHKNSIQKNDILNETYKLKNGFEYFLAKKAFYREESVGTNFQYFVFGELLTKDYLEKQTVYLILNVDYSNSTFDIIIPDKVEISEEEYLRIIKELSKNNTNEFVKIDYNYKEIEKNSNNTFYTNNTKLQYVLNYYMKDYSLNAVYYPEIAYSKLDKEYREQRFGNIEEYKAHIEKNKIGLLNYTIKEYNITEKDGYKEYVVIDINNNYYIFKVTDIMEYSVILDYYTTNVEQIISKYDQSTDQEKVAINIQKVASAINQKNYKYVYNKLNNTFKNNKFGTLENFEQYMSNIFIGNLELTFEEFYNEGETYIYNVMFKGKTASNRTQINMQIIMQLLENRDFVMSFNIE